MAKISMNKFQGIAIVLLASFVLFEQAGAACDYEEVVKECFKTLSRDRSSPQRTDRTQVTVTDLVKMFETGIPQICEFMDRFAACVERSTGGCNPDDSHAGRHFNRMKGARQFVCVKKRQEFTENTDCMISSNVKRGVENCQRNLLSDKSCKTVNEVISCVDPVIESNCPRVASSFGHTLRSYLKDRLELHDCDIQHKDHHDSDMTDHDHDHDHDHDGHDHTPKKGKSGAGAIHYEGVFLSICILVLQAFV